MRPVLIPYKTDKVKPADAPKNWSDLLDPKWKGQVSVGHPGFSGFVGTWVLQMKKLYGWDYFEELEKKQPQIGRSIIDTVTILAAGEAGRGAGPSAPPSPGPRGNPLGRDLSGGRLAADDLAVRDHEERQASERREAVHGVPVVQAGSSSRGRIRHPVAPRRRAAARHK